MGNSRISPDKKTWLDRFATLVGMVVPVVLYFAPASFNRRQRDLQQTQFRQTMEEKNHGRVMDRFASLGDSNAGTRLASVRSLAAYAEMGRVDQTAVSPLLEYLRTECEEPTFTALEQAIRSIANRTNGSELLQRLARTQRPGCPAAESPTSPPAPLSPPTSMSTSQYFAVGCGEVNEGYLPVQAPVASAAADRIMDTRASMENIDNLKASSVDITKREGATAVWHYRLVGLDRQLFGNCPGA